MGVDLREMAKASARMSWQVGARALAFGGLAMVMNLVCLASLGPELKRFLPVGVGQGVHAGGTGGLMTLVVILMRTLPSLIMIVLFLLGFPMAWFLVGKARGIQKAIQGLVARHGETLFLGFIERVESFALRLPDAPSPVAALPRYLARMEDLPWALRGVYRFLMRRASFRIAMESLLAQKAERLDATSLSRAAKAALHHPDLQAALAPGWGPAGILAGVNGGTFLALKLLL